MLRGSSIAPRASSNSRPDGGGDHGAVFDATSAVLSKLVAHFQAPNDASAAADAAALIEQRHQTVRYCQRLLESRLTPSAHLYSTDLAVKRRTSVISQRESASATDVHQVVQQGRVEQAVELSGLERAASAKQPRIAASALYVLHSLAANTTQSYSKAPVFSLAPLGAPPTRPTLVVEPATTHAAPPSQSTTSKAPATPSSDRDDATPEHELVRDCLHLLQGLDGQHIKWTPSNPGSMHESLLPSAHSLLWLSSSCRIDPCRRQLIEFVALIGYLFKRISAMLDPPTDAAQPPLGLIAQRLFEAVRDELTDYYRLIAILEMQLQDRHDDAKKAPLTLRKLYSWSHKPKERLSILYALLRAVSVKQRSTGAPPRGIEIASIIHSLALNGATTVSRFMNHLHNKVCNVLEEMVRRWLLDGELHDPFDEFFIACNTQVDVTSATSWDSRFFVRHEMLPSWLSPAIAQQILRTGKAIHFLRATQKGARLSIWNMTDETRLASARLSSSLSLTSAGHEQLALMIGAAYKAINQLVVRVLLDDHQLMVHVAALHDFVLMQDGNFAVRLTRMLPPELNKPLQQVYRHNLLAIVDGVARTLPQYNDDAAVPAPSSVGALLSATALPPSILECLDVQLAQSGAVGWDAFSLCYNVAQPLNSILTPHVVANYARVSSFLVLLKRAELTVSEVWQSAVSVRVSPVHRSVLGLRHLLWHFITHMQYHMTIEVIYTERQVLEQAMRRAVDLDSLAAAVHEHAERLVHRTFQDAPSAAVFQAITSILAQIERFGELVQSSSAPAPAEVREIEREFKRFVRALLRELERTQPGTLPFLFV